MLVERMLKTEEGMHVVLFSSVEDGPVASTSGRASVSGSESGARVQVRLWICKLDQLGPTWLISFVVQLTDRLFVSPLCT